MRRHLRTRMTVTVLIIILLSCLFISYFSYSSSIRLVEDSISQIAKNVVQNAVDVIDVEKYEQMTVEFSETEYYYELREQLNEIRETAGVDYLYTMFRKKVNDTYEYVYMVDGLPVGDENESLLGDPEEEIDSFPKIVETFESESLQVEMGYSEEWGGSVSAYLPIHSKTGHLIGILGADIDVTDVYQSMESNRNTFIWTILIILVISSITIYYFIYYHLKPLKHLTNQVEKVGEGDLNSKIDIHRTDEIGYLANAMNGMQQSLRDMIKNILHAAESVSGQGEQLKQSSHGVKQSSRQIAATMQELTSRLDHQFHSIHQLSSNMGSFSDKIVEANKYGQEIAVDSKVILELATEGKQLMDTSVEQMNTIHLTVKEAVQQVQDLNQQSDEITTLIQVIKAIADQTNLLALNASIEAARAGEHGAGFMIVAGEIRKLADQVKESIQDITGIVEQIQVNSKQMAESLVKGFDQVQEGNVQIQQTGESFTQIRSSISNVTDKIAMISNNLSTISQHSLLIHDSIDNISGVSEEVIAGVEQTSASIEETNSSIEEVSDSADRLVELAHNLNEQAKTFIIK